MSKSRADNSRSLVTVSEGYGKTVTLHKAGKTLRAGDIESGTLITFNRRTGEVIAIERESMTEATEQTAIRLAAEIADRVNEVMARTEDWLSDDFRRRTVYRHARDVIEAFLESLKDTQNE